MSQNETLARCTIQAESPAQIARQMGRAAKYYTYLFWKCKLFCSFITR